MNRYYLLLRSLIVCLCIVAGYALQAQIIYVTPDGAGDQSGSSWANAAPGTQLQNKIDIIANVRIWIAKGTYYPTAYPAGSSVSIPDGPGLTPRNYSFYLRSGTAMYGGFSGSETSLEQRNVQQNPTILSGDIGVPGDKSDNCFHVVVSLYNSSNTILDGFSIRDGNADASWKNTHKILSTVIYPQEGAGLVAMSSEAKFRNCEFSNNYSKLSGTVHNLYSSSTTFSNCVFSYNRSEQTIINNTINSYIELINCLFFSNATGSNRAVIENGIYNLNTSRMINCTICNNTGGGFANTSTNGTGNFTNCIISGNTYSIAATGTINTSYSLVQGGFTGTGNLDTEPLFVNSADPDGPDNILLTADDGFKLRFNSQAMNAGSNTALDPNTTIDITAAARVQDGTVDMGAYEGGGCPLYTTLYVDSSKAVSGNGLSWESAFKTLQEALDVANLCSSIQQVWVKKGTYYPSAFPGDCSSCPTDTRTPTFMLKNNLAIYGGFAGDETNINQRAITGNPTVLSGDIGIKGDNSDNAYHVLIAVNNDNTAVLDGFTVRDGNANVNGFFNLSGSRLTVINYYGAGLFGGSGTSSSPTISNCTFLHNNSANMGGAIYTVRCSPVLTNCKFLYNNSDYNGGAIYSLYSPQLSLTNCSFSYNTSKSGGGIYLAYSSATFTNSSFSYNSVNGDVGIGGAGLYSASSSASLVNCSFLYNSCTGTFGAAGGGLYFTGTNLSLTNCVFSHNSISGAYAEGGGLKIAQSSSTKINNCSFTHNSSGNGGGIYNNGSGTTLTNCIIWGNTASSNPGFTDYNAGGIMTNSLVQGGYSGAGNIHTDPLFINEADPDGADDIFGTGDDGLRLSCSSPAINKGNNIAIPGITTDITGSSRIQYSVVDMGAYESSFNTPLAPAVHISANPGSTVCAGTPVTFTASSVNGGSPVYQWKKNGVIIWNGNPYIANDLLNNDTITVQLTSNASCIYPAIAGDTITVTVKPKSEPTLFSATACGSYELPWGQVVTQSGDYTHTYTNVNGCDSIVTAHITINHASEPTSFSATACGSYRLPWGDVVTSSNAYTHTYQNVNGCDSAVTAHITINYVSTPTSFSATACGSYILPWGGVATSSNDYTHTYQNVNGCDSIVTAHITINYPSEPTSFSATACGSYTLPWGDVATSSNAYTHTYQNVNGCDSTVTAHITVNYASEPTSFSATACGSYTLPWGDVATSSNVYTHTYRNINGCDSVVTAHITINYASTPTSFKATACGSYTLPWAQTVNTSGDYVHTYKNKKGCDSVVTAHITIYAVPVKPVISYTGATTFYAGGSITLSAPAGYASYLWSNNAATSSITVTQSGNYTVKVTNNNSCSSLVSDAVQVTVLASPVSVSHLDGDNGQLANNNIRPYLQLNNETNSAVAYKDITIRYWLTVEDFAPLTSNLVIDWAQLGTNKVKMKYVKLGQPCQGAYGYIEYSFDATAGNLAGGSNSGPVQSRVGKNDWTNFNETDDHSYARNTSYTKNNKITVYKNGVRVWGTEPSAITPVQSLKAYSQDKSSGTTTNTISNWVKLNNEGNIPVSYKDITVRYWFTADGNTPLNYYLDYAQMGSSNIKWKFVKLSPVFPVADTYLEIGFTAADSLYPVSTTGNIQHRIAKNDWSNFNQLNDHSYKAGQAAFTENIKMTVYVKGVLVYGQEPTGAAARQSSQEVVTGKKESLSSKEEISGLTVKALNNPVTGNEATFIVKAAPGERVQVILADVSGKVIGKMEFIQSSPEERKSLSFRNTAQGMLFLKVNTQKETKTIQLLASVGNYGH